MVCTHTLGFCVKKKLRLHYDNDRVTVLLSTVRIVQLSQERLLILGAGLYQFFL